MIKKKTMWAVTHDLEIETKTVIVEDDKLLAAKDASCKDGDYRGKEYYVIGYFNTEEEAKNWVEDELQTIRDMVPKIKKFIDRLDYSGLRKKLGIEKVDYLGSYGKDHRNGYYQNYKNECEYAEKLETFINSRMLNIARRMIPIDQIREIQWYAIEEAEDYEPSQWKAVLKTKSDGECATCSEEDVRLIWATIGKCIGSWFIDNDINYDKDEDE